MPARRWNDADDRLLLLTIIQVISPQIAKWDQIAERMGSDFTESAVYQRYNKLKKSALSASNNAGGATATPKATPKKAGEGKSTGKRKAMKDVGETENGEQDDEEESPVKKKVKEEIKEEVVSHSIEEDSDDGLLV